MSRNFDFSHANKMQRNRKAQGLYDLVNDAWRFVLLHKDMIGIAPLQVYTSALMFSPTNSLINRLYNLPDWISLRPKIRTDWDNCLQAFNCSDAITSLAFSSDDKKLASGHLLGIIIIWDVTSGFSTHIFEAHDGPVLSLAFSPDDTQIACSGKTGQL